jgi:Icc-related predicted phosphoesterase
MKILIFSDIHGDLGALERVVAQPADIYIAAGDLCNFGKGLERFAPILQPLGERLFVLPGNHETHEQTKAFRQTRKLNGTNWAGLGYSNITPFKTPGEYSEAEIAAALAPFAGLEKLYLVVHFPPRDTKLDEYAEGQHAGSPTLRTWVEKEKPLYLFCGHIHETAGMTDRLGTTQCINVGKEGYTIEV